MILIAILFVIIYVIYSKFINTAYYWQKKGIFHVKPWSRFGKVFLGNKSFFESVIDGYNEYPDRRYYGSYQFLKPSLFVRDLELIKKITVKDFENFPDHLNFVNEKSEPVLSLNLFSLQGKKWRDMRSTLSPAFSSAKMKSMYVLIQETAEKFSKHFSDTAEDLIELEMKNVYSRFTSDVIANCAFGIECDSLKEENNQFFTMGTFVATPRGFSVIRGLLISFFPKFVEFFRISLFPPNVTEFFRKLIKETTTYRQQQNIVRPDMIHLLMEAKKGRLKHESGVANETETGFATVEESSLGTSISKMEITDDVMTAQALVFFLAGFDTTSTMLSFLSYELALNPGIQAKLHKEIDETLENCNGKVTYEQVSKMKYLDQVVSEALRKYPPGYVLTRVCTKEYKIPATKNDEVDLVLEEGCAVTIPVAGLHRDPTYFPDPNTFDPDRFSEENKGKIVPGSYMPFGSGPRNCIGSRFALLQGKALAVSLLSRFQIVPTKKTSTPMKASEVIEPYSQR
ncbi:hypothetical protein NQ317_007504 [Molorchus minor]|uniref:Cytochrome P450 n=1 Tax=Molorchus minor TaxID=1323400 RepID=A0ABQ9J5Z8_9CUCU|nr:hypothetical protein NQ317_007504 [Molorchus minor]